MPTVTVPPAAVAPVPLTPTLGLYLAAAAVLVAGGWAKAVHPGDTARALVSLRAGRSFPLGTAAAMVRVLALLEVGIGLGALVVPGRIFGLLVGASYGAFTVVVLVARRRGGALASCGCFGRPDTPPTGVHAALDAVLAVAALVLAAGMPAAQPVTWLLARQPWSGIPLVVLSAVGAGLAGLVMTSAAVLAGVRASGPAPRSLR